MNNWNGIASLFIACIELILLINVFIFAEKNKINFLVISIIFLLMFYQAFEFIMCNLGLDSSFNAFWAFADISFLPPLGLYFVLTFYNYRSKYFVFIFLPAIAFVIYYSTIIEQFNVNACTVFYAIYKYPQGDLYGLFYYTPVLVTMALLIHGIRKSPDERVVHLSKVLLTAYILISIPVVTAFVLALSDQMLLVHSIVSVMCKFAVLLAVALTYFALNKIGVK
ncbi:MAG TPA: hypothetical protein VKA26_11880 [Ignavibacteriaceae bacterium]|nr:hypothetical protein [Ignavibacteriaceae bacterium]